MTQVFLSLGSNVEPRHHLKGAVASLRAEFGEVVLSPVYESIAVGFDGDNFLNLVAEIDTDLTVARLSRCLRAVEQAHGRRRDTPRFSSRSLDIDILTYGEAVGVIDGITLPRPEIEQYAFVIVPLADIAGMQRYPVSGTSYRVLCAQVVTDQSALWPVDIQL